MLHNIKNRKSPRKKEERCRRGIFGHGFAAGPGSINCGVAYDIMKKKILSLVLCSALAAALPVYADEAKPEITTVTPGVLTVATSPDFAPYEFYAIDEDGEPQLAGFDIALAEYIADYIGLELEIIPIDFDGVIMELQTKSVDLGLAGLSADPKRDAIMDFSEIYYKGGQSFVCLEENKDEFKTLEDVNKAGLEIGAQTGSIQVDLAMENSPDADIVQLTKVTEIIAELIAGKLDGAYIETAVAESYAVNYPELCVVLEVPYDASEGSAVGVSKGNEELLAAVNEAVLAALEDGSMDRFVAEANELATGEIIEGLLEDEDESSSYGDVDEVMSYGDYIDAEFDTEVTVETYVQASQSWWNDTLTVYAQDEEGAYFLYNMACSEEEAEELVPGTKIRVTGWKSEWAGEVEIVDSTYEIIEDADEFIAEPVDVTGYLGTDELEECMNFMVSFTGLTVEPSTDADGNEFAFLYNWDGSGSHDANSDLYFNASVNGETYTFTVESYLCDNTTDVYEAVEALEIGQEIDLEGFLYWYNGPNPHITSVTVK